MKPKEISQELLRLTEQSEIAITPLAPELGFKSPYAPINTYLDQIQKGSKPETASEGLFRELIKEFLDVPAIPQVGLGSGFVDFKLDAREESSIVIELKALFHSYSAELLKSFPLKPADHHGQIERYLHYSEYVVLTDLRDAFLYSARDVWQVLKPFGKIPFAELLERASSRRSLLDVLRDIEDGEERPDLDRSFFEQLKEWFRAFDQVKFQEACNHDELVIQLLNQIIFAKTMEDYSLVRYRQLQDDWEEAKERWKAKGAPRIVKQFLHDFEEFFEDYYDTELFERSIWEHLDKDEKNLVRFAQKLEAVLGVDEWSKTFQRGIVHYNYRLINEDIFGKSYEMFLAANRKDEGIFYTPASITTPMADSLVKGLFDPLVAPICDAISAGKADFATANKLMLELARITIADTAAGSGGFLIKVLRAVWEQYQKIDAGCQWVKNWQGGGDFADTPPNVQQARTFREQWNMDNRRVRVAQILLRHIFAVDKDAGAIEVAKTNLWKEAVKLSTEDYNFRRLTGDINRTLPSLRLNFICADSLVDTGADLQVAYLSDICGEAMKKLCALREKYIENPSDHGPLEEALTLQAKLRENLTEHFQGEPLPAPPIFIALSFFPAWFNKDGSARKTDEQGFDGIIGNPPWETAKPMRKEFAQQQKYARDARDFDAWFQKKLKEDAGFRAKWEKHELDHEKYKEYLGRRFQKQGTGDWNFFKLFIERDLSIVRNGGQFSLLIPSGFQTDEGCADLRRWFCTENNLLELTSFENRGYKQLNSAGKEESKQIFPDVDSRFKFSFFKVVKGPGNAASHTFDARFYLHDPKHVFAPAIKYDVGMIRRFSPDNFGIMEFRSKRDYELCAKIRGEHRLLKQLGMPFRREFHITEDAHFFKKIGSRKLSSGECPLFEGKMIHQYDEHFAPATYYVEEKEAGEELLRKEIFRLAQFIRETGCKKLEGKTVPAKKEELSKMLEGIFKRKKFKLHYESPRLAYRKIGSSTNERTIISTIVKAGACLGESLNYLTPFEYSVSEGGVLEQNPVSDDSTHLVLCLLNSLILNFYIRSKISANVNLFYLYELPIADATVSQKKKLSGAACKLLKDPRDIKERAALEVFIARELYRLSLDDWKHLTGTFTFGGDSETKAELDEIIRLSIEAYKK